MDIKSTAIKSILAFLILFFFTFCGSRKSQTMEAKILTFPITSLSDKDYPDNPNIGFSAENYSNEYFETGIMVPLESNSMKVGLRFRTLGGDSIWFDSFELSEFIPTIPTAIRGDEYLSYIACINQEWNRNQVAFGQDQFTTTDPNIIRVDIARNCLNAYLWEVIAYTREKGETLPYAQGWFDFPKELYAQLFEEKNKIPFDRFREFLENWVEPKSEVIDFTALRQILDTIPTRYADSSATMYPLAGARKKKFKEIIYPDSFQTMKELQSDSTLFATFTPPGFYNREDPRTTELGRFYTLDDASVYQVKSKLNGDTLHELHLQFSHRKGDKKTHLTLGGIDLLDIPHLPVHEANSAWKNSMGIANHTFYEDGQTHNRIKAATHPYYALLTNGGGAWLDSHKLGIDGPILHFSDAKRTVLHLWLLSFERHALVGHYVFQLGENPTL